MIIQHQDSTLATTILLGQGERQQILEELRGLTLSERKREAKLDLDNTTHLLRWVVLLLSLERKVLRGREMITRHQDNIPITMT